MRSTKELLTIILEIYEYDGNAPSENLFPGILTSGLCNAVNMCKHSLGEQYLNFEERELVRNYLKHNLPKRYTTYSWPQGEKAPRIVWLKKQISEL